jgi:hypothetical protein
LEAQQSITLTGLIFNHALCGGLGYLVFGWIGFWCCLAAVTAWYARLIWLLACPPQPGRGDGWQSDSEPGVATDPPA